MSSDVEPSCYRWLSSFFSGCVSRNILVISGVLQGVNFEPRCMLYLVCNEVDKIFSCERDLFYADNMILVLPEYGFQDCLKIQSDLNKLAE
jgi:hypothetical protein